MYKLLYKRAKCYCVFSKLLFSVVLSENKQKILSIITFWNEKQKNQKELAFFLLGLLENRAIFTSGYHRVIE